MKTKILLFAAAVMLAGWSCKNDDTPPTADVTTPDAVQNALDNGYTTVTLTTPLSGDAIFVVSNLYAENTGLNITIPANGYNVTFQQDDEKSQHFPILNLKVTSAETVNIETPDCSVIYTGSAGTLNATTAATTLVLTKGSAVSTLNVLQGNARIYGTAANVVNSGSGKVLLAIGAGSDRPSTDNIIKQTLALGYIDGIILTEDSYPLFADIAATGTEFGQSDPSYAWYLPIEKDGFEIIGDGRVKNIILYGKQELADGIWSTQNLVTVFASEVTISGITLMNKVEGNKVIEVLNSDFTLSDCRIVPNTFVSSGATAYVGEVMFSRSADNGLVDACYFNRGAVTIDGLASGTFLVKGSMFDSVYGDDSYAVATTNSPDNDVSASTMTLTLDGNEFGMVPQYNAATMDHAVLEVSYGKVVADDNVFPTEGGIYYNVTGTGELVLNGVTIVATE